MPTNSVAQPQPNVDAGYNLGYTFGMKTAISVPDPVFEAAEQLARKLRVSRSQLYTTALREFIQSRSDAEITRKLNEVYSQEDSALDATIGELQRRSVGGSEW